MKKDDQENIVNLTRNMIRAFWNNDEEMLENSLHPDVLLIGMNENHYFHGRDAFVNTLNAHKGERPLADVRDEEFEVVYSAGDWTLVAGRYTLYTDPDSGMVLVIKKRATLFWEKAENGYLARHVHFSEGIGLSGEAEFPASVGRETYRYMLDLMRQHGDMVKVTVKDTEGVTHIISENDILRISTEGNYTTIHCFDRTVRMKKPLKFVRELLHTNIFIDISRSTVINAEYVEKVGGDTITMLDHTEIHISSRKVRDVLKKIKELTEL